MSEVCLLSRARERDVLRGKNMHTGPLKDNETDSDVFRGRHALRDASWYSTFVGRTSSHFGTLSSKQVRQLHRKRPQPKPQGYIVIRKRPKVLGKEEADWQTD